MTGYELSRIATTV
jgi:hypothetical protein